MEILLEKVFFKDNKYEGLFKIYSKVGELLEGASYKKGRKLFCFDKYFVIKQKCDYFKIGTIFR